MKAILQSIIIALFILAMSMPAKAFISGNDLSRYCDESIDSNFGSDVNYDTGMCTGLILGSSQGLVVGFNFTGATLFCKPNNVTNSQYIKIVAKYLNSYPEELHKPVAVLVADALIQAFPCKGAEPSVK
jgi:hypothetical protein